MGWTTVTVLLTSLLDSSVPALSHASNEEVSPNGSSLAGGGAGGPLPPSSSLALCLLFFDFFLFLSLGSLGESAGKLFLSLGLLPGESAGKLALELLGLACVGEGRLNSSSRPFDVFFVAAVLGVLVEKASLSVLLLGVAFGCTGFVSGESRSSSSLSVSTISFADFSLTGGPLGFSSGCCGLEGGGVATATEVGGAEPSS